MKTDVISKAKVSVYESARAEGGVRARPAPLRGPSRVHPKGNVEFGSWHHKCREAPGQGSGETSPQLSDPDLGECWGRDGTCPRA